MTLERHSTTVPKTSKKKDARWPVHGHPWIAGTCNSTAVSSDVLGIRRSGGTSVQDLLDTKLRGLD